MLQSFGIRPPPPQDDPWPCLSQLGLPIKIDTILCYTGSLISMLCLKGSDLLVFKSDKNVFCFCARNSKRHTEDGGLIKERNMKSLWIRRCWSARTVLKYTMTGIVHSSRSYSVSWCYGCGGGHLSVIPIGVLWFQWFSYLTNHSGTPLFSSGFPIFHPFPFPLSCHSSVN